ncbi:hypothetical protein Pan181_26700 [Aeoliella mucimassa]|uniref:HEAT repeat protein n=2 Tax=Aeoliella mucimassa TaxID=2527972 RepID=A0A518AP36_9BACT|nr:hypothetical protein Pan181_26700 [Aeoliella mucimassa]
MRITGYLVLIFAALLAPVHATEVTDAIEIVRTASPTTATSDEIRAAWKTLADAEVDEIPTMLRGMGSANPAVENWLRTAVDAVFERALASKSELPKAALVDLLADTQAAPRGRRTAYELLEQIDPPKAQELLVNMMEDPSLEIRYDSVAANLELADAAEGEAKQQQLHRILGSARDLEQIEQCITSLEEFGEEIDLAAHLGYIKSWRLCGVFDNSSQGGFAVVYPPEQTIDFAASYEGKEETAQWQSESISTDDSMGKVDLNDLIGPEKGAAAYAYTEIEVAEMTPIQVRYISPNATKLWVNGQLVASNEVYHGGTAIDQYIVDVTLQAGVNKLLIKVCQNEQTDAWAQVWEFQLRLTDQLGGAIDFTPIKQ